MKDERYRLTILFTLGCLAGLTGMVYLSCGDDSAEGEVEENQCPACPANRLCDPTSNLCVAKCNHPNFLCTAPQVCNPDTNACENPVEEEGSVGEGSGTEGEGEGGVVEGEGEGEGQVGEGEGEGEGEGGGQTYTCGDSLCEEDKGETEQNCPPDCRRCPNGICEADRGETEATCPLDCKTSERNPVCGEDLCPPAECGLNLCHAHETCVDGKCTVWECGNECKGSSKCVKNPQADSWTCEQLPCEEDRYRATNNARRTAARVESGTFPLSFCATTEDWFSIALPANSGFVARLAFSLNDVDLDVELYQASQPDSGPVAAAVGQEAGAALTYNVPGDAGGEYLVRVFQRLPEGANVVQMFYSMALRVIENGRACNQVGDCDMQNEICNAITHACEQKDCRINFECCPLQSCNDADGTCIVEACNPDMFSAANPTNNSSATAAVLDLNQQLPYTDLTICNGEWDWYKIDLAAGKCLSVQVDFYVCNKEITYDLDAALYGPKADAEGETPLVQVMRRGRDNEMIRWTTLEAGPHYLVVRQGMHNIYNITLSATDGECQVGCNPDDPMDSTCLDLGMRCSAERRICIPFGD